ncbi:MAG: carboxy terminal-processing peptidase [Pseudomonadota bacterium]
MPSPAALSSALLLLAALLLSPAVSAFTPLQPDDGQRDTLREVVRELDKRHYRKLELDDRFAAELLELYVKRLDPARNYLLAGDLAEFAPCRSRFDDELRAAALDCAYRIYNRFGERLRNRLEANLARLESDAEFDFEVDESLPLDTDKGPWLADAAAADEYWRLRLKDSLLRLLLSGKEPKDARELLIKRYRTQLARLDQQTPADVFELFANAVAGMYDPHTAFMDARSVENFQISMSLSLEGIGAVLQSEDEHTKVVRVVPGGPADKDGRLHAGDRIIGVGQGKDGELVDVIGWRLDDVVELIRGKKGTEVRLEILPAAAGAVGTSHQLVIVRDEVALEEQAARGDVISVPAQPRALRLGVVTLPTFYMDFEAYRNHDENFRSTTRDVFNILQKFRDQNVDGIILDLRNNGGGSLYEATALTDLFIDPGPVVQIRHANRKVSLDQMAERPAMYRGPLLVMINRLSASASEIFAAAIQDYGRGLVVGTQSFGKGTVQILTPLREGQLKLTQSKFYRVSGDSTQERGVMPDIAFLSLYDLSEIGESAQDRALPWDRIEPAAFDPYDYVEGTLEPLARAHRERVARDPDWNYLIGELELIERNRAIQRLPLRRATREQMEKDRETTLFALANRQRAAKGEPPYASLEDWRADRDPDAAPQDDSAPAEEPAEAPGRADPDKDPLLKEASHILADYLGLLAERRQKVAERDSDLKS